MSYSIGSMIPMSEWERKVPETEHYVVVLKVERVTKTEEISLPGKVVPAARSTTEVLSLVTRSDSLNKIKNLVASNLEMIAE